MFQLGDYVYPTDLPVRLLCRVTRAARLNPGGEGFQVLTLTPRHGPSPAAAQLIRFAEHVRPAPGSTGPTGGQVRANGSHEQTHGATQARRPGRLFRMVLRKARMTRFVFVLMALGVFGTAPHASAACRWY